MAILLREVVSIIRFDSKVEIILQEQEIFPDRKNDKVIWNKKYSYGDYREFGEYKDYKVCMFAQKDDCLQIYICKFGR